jgi:hypothetical protein
MQPARRLRRSGLFTRHPSPPLLSPFLAEWQPQLPVKGQALDRSPGRLPRWPTCSAAQLRSRSDYQPVHSLPFMNKKVSFADRVDLIKAAVADLRAVLEIIEAEAKAMAEAQERFAAKKPRRSVN